MTIKQRILKAVYPAIIWWDKFSGKNVKVLENEEQLLPKQPFYDLSVNLINGENRSMSAFKGKKVLLVNTASNCGYTGQYEELQHLYEKNQDRLVVIGFPANDFREQEKGDDKQIASFCSLNYGVKFPLVEKTSVVKGHAQNKVFEWLTGSTLNGWNSQQPEWNFSKYLINEQGVLTHYFGPGISPAGEEIASAIAD